MRLLEPTQIREQTHEILSRSEFQRSKSIFAKAWEWIVDHLPKFGGGTGSFAGVGMVFQWLLLVLLVAGMVLLAWWVARNWVGGGRRKGRGDDVEVEIDARRSVSQWRRVAEAFEADGEWKQALRCRYGELVGSLVERDLVAATLGRTTGELRLDVQASLPTVAGEFSEATQLFELAWYADRGTGPEENRRVRDLAALIAAARPTDSESDTEPEPEPIGAVQ